MLLSISITKNVLYASVPMMMMNQMTATRKVMFI